MHRSATSLAACLLLASCKAPSVVTTPPSAAEIDGPTDGLFLDGFFPLGVFSQPTDTLETWARRGCNAMFEVPQGTDPAVWDEEAQRLGLRVIRAPLADPSADIGRTDLLAWSLPDEPDVEANKQPCGGDCIGLSESLSSKWREIDPTRRIFVNLAGPNVLLGASCDFCNGPGDDPPQASCFPDNDTCYPRIIASADWISQDIYPVTGWLPTEQVRNDVTLPGRALDRLAAWSDKPKFAIIEVSHQRMNFAGVGKRGPTPGETRAQLWNAIIHGARGIFYFPQAFNPFVFDATPPEVLDELQRQHASISRLAKVLQSEINPAAFTVAVDAPLEVTWRNFAGAAYVIVLNTSSSALSQATITVRGLDGSASVQVVDEARDFDTNDGTIVDGFEAHGVHVYRLDGP